MVHKQTSRGRHREDGKEAQGHGSAAPTKKLSIARNAWVVQALHERGAECLCLSSGRREVSEDTDLTEGLSTVFLAFRRYVLSLFPIL